MTINDILKGYFDQHIGSIEVYSSVCKVLSVNKTERTCDVKPLNGDPGLFDVKLQSELSKTDGFILLPKKGSIVVVNFINAHSAYVALQSEIESLEIVVQGKKVVLDKKGLLIASATSNLKSELNTLLNEIDGLYDLIIQPGLFVAGNIPVLISPTAAPKLAQKKLKIQQLKTAINSFLTD